jgi:hypothetical protein
MKQSAAAAPGSAREMDEADGVSAGSKRQLEGESNGKGAASPPHQPPSDAAADQKDRDRMRPNAPRISLMTSSESGRRSTVSATQPQVETLMSYELVRHQVQRRLHVEKISTDAIHALVPDVEFRLFQLLQVLRCRIPLNYY